MPLNPPSFSGQDVWYSPDVFVNKSEVALWQPANARDPFSDPDIRAWIEGCEIAAEGDAEGNAQAGAYRQRLVEQGFATQEEIDSNRSVRPNDATPRDDRVPSTTPPPVSTATEGVENLSSFPMTLQLSRYFTLGQMLTYNVNAFNSLPLAGGGTITRNLTKGQVVANLKLLAMNVLDPVRERYPECAPTNTWRPEANPDRPGAGGQLLLKQHPRGQAADIAFGNIPFERYYDIAIWIRDTIQFDQMLLEYNPRVAWIHISWNPSGNRPNGVAFKVATFNCLDSGDIRTQGLVNLAPQLGLSGFTRNNPRGRNARPPGT